MACALLPRNVCTVNINKGVVMAAKLRRQLIEEQKDNGERAIPDVLNSCGHTPFHCHRVSAAGTLVQKPKMLNINLRFNS
jgi:hypothetical protein